MAREEIFLVATIVQLMGQDDDEDLEVLNELIEPTMAQEVLLQNGRGDPDHAFVGVENYAEETVWTYPDIFFKKHFRMTRNAFEVILGFRVQK